jgi:hypothetical protein
MRLMVRPGVRDARSAGWFSELAYSNSVGSLVFGDASSLVMSGPEEMSDAGAILGETAPREALREMSRGRYPDGLLFRNRPGRC